MTDKFRIFRRASGRWYIASKKKGENQNRWKREDKEKPFDLIRDQIIIETSGETLLKVMRTGTVSTNIYLRRLHNFCLDIPRKLWPKVSNTTR